MKKYLIFLALFFTMETYAHPVFNPAESEAAAKILMASFTPEQKSKACFGWKDTLRTVWHNLPLVDFDRKGLWLRI